VLPEGNDHAVHGGFLDDDEIGDAADGDQVSRKGAGGGQNVPQCLCLGGEAFGQEHHRRDVAGCVGKEHRGEGEQIRIGEM